MRLRTSEVAARLFVPIAVAILAIVSPSEFSKPVEATPSRSIQKHTRKSSHVYRPSTVNNQAALVRQEPQAGPRDIDYIVPSPPVFSPRAEAPAVAATTTDGSVFSSVAFRIGGLPAKARWGAAIAAAGRMDMTACGAEPCSPRVSDLASAVERARTQDVTAKLATINAAVNHAVVYTRDQDVYGVRDYWAKPDETLARGKGDCEDFAILKMAALKAAGLPEDSITLVVLRDTRRNLFHAVLSVATDKGQFILDNLRDNVPRDITLSDYQALYSMNGDRAFIHGYPASSKLAAGKGLEIGTALPGEDSGGRS
jgi:predicted transglutaminase-like cysteine proteinase